MRHVRKNGKTLWICLLTVLSLASVSVYLMLPPTENPRLAAFPEAFALSLAVLPLGYRALLTKKRALTQPGLWLLAALFAGVVTLAQSFAAVGTTQPLTQSLMAKLKTLLFFAGRVPLYYMVMALLRRALGKDDLFLSPSEQGDGASRLHSLAGQPGCLVILTLLLLLCWLPYYLCTFPGTVSNDSITQLKEIYQVKPLSAGNPLGQTFLLSLFCWLGQLFGGADAAVAFYCGAQAILMAVLLAYAVRLLLQAGSPPWLCGLSLGFFALCPVFPVFAFCVGKDTNFAMAVLFFSLMIWQILRQPEGAPLPREIGIGLCLSAALLALLRNPGFYLAALALLLLLAWMLVKNRQTKGEKTFAPVLCALLTLGIVYAGLHLAALPLSGAKPMPETEEYSLPLQQVARVVASNPESLTPEEKAAISGVLDFSRIKAEYNGELSDPIKDLWNEQASPEQKRAFFDVWFSLLRKHPGTCFSATFHNIYGYLTPGYVSTIKPTLLIGKQGHTTDIDPFFSFSVNPRAERLKAVMDALMGHSLFRLVLAPGLYGWVALFALVSLAFSRQKRLLLVAFPALFTLAGCLLSAVNGYFRYAMPLYFCAPVLLALCATAISPSSPITSKE